MMITRKKSRNRSECGLLALPEELLLKILAHLRLPALVSVRLVCRLLRKHSYALITTLNMNEDDEEGLDHAAESIVDEQLRSLPGLTKLRYFGDPRDCAELLTLPGCAPKLRELNFLLRTYPDMEVDGDFFTKLKCATVVTSLKWSHLINGRESGQVDALLPLALANSPQLVSLKVSCKHRVLDSGLGSIVRLTALERLRLERRLWLQLLPHLASFPCLKDIGCVPFEEQDAVEKVAALTTLTRLGAKSLPRFRPCSALSQLSALQSLSLDCSQTHGEIGVEPLIRSVPQLTELTLRGCHPGSPQLSQAVASLRCLESLQLDLESCPISRLLEAPLHRLRHFSVALSNRAPSQVPALCSALAGLERLSLTSWKSSFHDLVPHLSQLTRLTALKLAVEFPSEWRVPASFLTDLTGLVDLRLLAVLSANNARSDIPCLAVLTRLQWLVVHSVSPAGLARILLNPSLHASVKRVPVKRRDLKPLSALRMLEGWELREAWHWKGDDPEVVNSLVGKLCGICDYSTGHPVLEQRRWRRSAFGYCTP